MLLAKHGTGQLDLCLVSKSVKVLDVCLNIVICYLHPLKLTVCNSVWLLRSLRDCTNNSLLHTCGSVAKYSSHYNALRYKYEITGFCNGVEVRNAIYRKFDVYCTENWYSLHACSIYFWRLWRINHYYYYYYNWKQPKRHTKKQEETRRKPEQTLCKCRLHRK